MITIGDIINFLEAKNSLYELREATAAVTITGPSPIGDAQSGSVSFCGATAKDTQQLLSKTRASLLIVDQNIPLNKSSLTRQGVQAIILSDDARLDFIRVVEHFFTPPAPSGIHQSAVIAASAVIAPSVFVGPLCTVGHNVNIGERTVIHAGVHIYDAVRIGRNVVINSGTVIGADGFGYQRNEAGKLEKFPHMGGVVIEDDVEIHALVQIARGTLGDTVIGQGTKIDAFCHISHNVKIGKNCVVVSHALLGGSVTVGDNCWIAPCACLRDRIHIGSGVTVGLASLVTKDVPDGQTVMGTPARPIEEQKKLIKKMSDLARNK